MAYSYGRSFDDKYYDGNRKEDLRNTKDLRRSQGNPLRETHLSGLAASRGKDHGDKLRESRIPDYLEFDVFGYLDDYDDAGYDRKKPGNPHNRTQTENPYGWDALGQTGKPPVEGDALRSSRAHVLRETNVAGVPRIGEGEDPYARGLTTEQSRAITFRNTVQEYGEGPGQNSNGQTAIGRTRLQSEKDENPYGHRVLGRTVPSSSYKSTSDVTSDTQDTIQVRSTSQHLGTSGYSPNAFGKQELPGYGRGNVTDLRSTNIKSTEDQPYRKTNDYPLVSDVARRLDSDIKAQKHWTSMALDFGLRNSWYSLFGKIRKKWAAGYASTDMATTANFVKDNGSDGGSSKNENVWLSDFRLRIIIVVTIVLVTISVAIIVPVALFAGKDEVTGKELFRMYDLEAVFINGNFTDDMSSPTSESFKALNYTLCIQLLKNGKAKSDKYTYRDCFVLTIRPGSIKVLFRIVVSTTVNLFPKNDTVLSELGLRSDNDTFELGKFIVNATIIFQNSTDINGLNSAFLKGIPYNASCNGVVDQCNTSYSACINETCQCIKNYWYKGAVCLPVTCSSALNISNGTITSSKNRVGDVLEVKCFEGFNLTTNVSVCMGNGNWSVRPKCQPIPCPTYGLPANARQLVSLNGTFGEKIELECKLGYTIKGNETVQCLATGNWSTSPECVIIDCGKLNVTGYVNITYSSGTTFSNKLTFQCDRGYKIIGENVLNCTEHGNWTGTSRCEQKLCPAPNVSKFHVIHPKNHTNTVDSVFNITCIDGYFPTTNVMVTCMENETWSTFHECSPIDCEEPEPKDHAWYFNLNSTTFNSTFEVNCSTGYEIEGNATLVCQSSGNWSDLPNCTKVTCDNYSIPNNSHVVNKTGVHYNDSIFFECDEGYDLNHSVIICMADKNWSGYPTCTIKDCGNISGDNLHVTYPNASTTFGSTAFLNCTDGFDRMGTASVACQASGKWGQLPLCVNKTGCGDFVIPPHSSINKSSAENVTLVCDAGYNLKGTPLVKCVNPIWISGSCQPVCLNFNLSENAESSNYNNLTIYSAGDIVNVSCRRGFGTTDNQTVTCLNSRNWTKVPVCHQTHCFEKDLPENVNISISTTNDSTLSNLYNFSETIYIECLPGFTNKGDTKITCMTGGKWSNFSACEEVTCSLANFSEHFNLSQTSRVKSYTPNDSVSLSCYAGFKVNGKNSLTVSCTIHGNWSEIVDCQLVTCDNYSLPKNSMFVNSSLANRAPYNFNTTIEITCEAGYALVNYSQKFVTCEANGEWEGKPACYISGNISFARNTSRFLVGQRENISCTLTNAAHWKNVAFGKINNGQDGLTPILVLTNVTGHLNATKNDTAKAHVNYTVQSDGVTIVLTFDPVSCENEGQYICFQIVSEKPLTISSLQPEFLRSELETTSDIAYVDTYENATTRKFELKVPENVTDHRASSVCTAFVSKEAANSSQMINITISYNTSTAVENLVVNNTVEPLNSSEDTCYINVARTALFTLSGTGSIDVECRLVIRDSVANTTVKTVNVLPGTESFRMYDFEAVFINENFTTDMLSPTSESFKTLNDIVCTQLLKNGKAKSDKYTYQDCFVLTIRPGSIIVQFRIVVSTTVNLFPKNDTVLSELGLRSDNDTFELDKFIVNATISFKNSTNIDSLNSAFLKEKQHGSDCNSTFDRCVTSFSACINGTCQCIMTHFYNGSTCLPITCPVPDVTGGNVNTSGIYFKDMLSVSCDEGFQLTPPNFTQLICIKNGTWGTLPKCSVVVCKEFQIPNASVNGNTTGRVFKDIITVSCDEGFEVDGNGTSECQSDGNWSMTPSCNPVHCPEFQKPSNAYLEPNVTQNLTYKQEIRVNCENGYKIDWFSSSNTICQANGTWSSHPFCKPINCSAPDLPYHLSVTTHNVSYLFDSQIELECDSGYNLVGNNTIDCMADGNWSSFPVCEPVVCDTQNLSGHIIFPDRLNRTFGNTVEIQCEVGYKTNGNTTIVCLKTGYWSESPDCEPIDCEELDGQKNMNLTYSNGTTFNETITVTCYDGYKLIGDNMLWCTENGKWNGTAVCEQKVCLAPNASDYPFITPFQNKTFEVGSEITVTCKEGYAPTTNVTVTCFEDETWSDFPSCDPVDCGDPMQIDNAENFTVNNTKFNSFFEVTCLYGFERKGNKTVSCQATGNWSDNPVCHKIQCFGKDLPEAINSSKAIYEINETVSMQCSPGFVNKGDNQITCMPDGNWSSVFPCKAVTCGNYTLPDRAMFINQTEASNAPFDFNTTLEITCEPGYALVIDIENSVTCETDGTWQGAPECVLQGTISFSAPRSQFTIGERATISCTLSNAPDWKSVIVGLQTTQYNMNPIFIVTNVSGNMSVDNRRTNTVNVTHQEHRDGITITVIFDPVSCNNTGNYVCAHVDINKTLTINDINYATLNGSNGKVNFTYVQTYANMTDLQLSAPENVTGRNVTGRNVTAVCTGVVGIDAENSRLELNVSVTNVTSFLQLDNSDVVSIETPPGSCYSVTKSATFRFTGNGTLEISCLLMLDGEKNKIKSVKVNVCEDDVLCSGGGR